MSDAADPPPSAMTDAFSSQEPGAPRAGPEPSATIEDLRAWLAQSAGLAPAEVTGVLQAEQVRHWRNGERVPVEAYLQLVPALQQDGELILDLICGEVLLRQERGESPTLAEYLWRFPRYKEPLRLQFEIDQGLGEELPAAAPAGQVDRSTLTWSSDRTGRPRLANSSWPRVPGYTILEELGRGGMGVVYKARQLRLNRIVALKMILAGAHAGAEATLRFLSEAEVVARLRHPQIIQIHATGDHEGLPFVEFEYVEGGSLAGRLDGTPWTARDAATLIERLARGIAAAHQKEVVHRDLKPANILLTGDGTPKIADFGLAKALDGNLGLTRTESLLGSPEYMAPEQAGENARQVGPAADVYALGAIFYELLTGRPPFKAASVMETIEQVRHSEPLPPSRLVPGLPRDAETISLKCLAKEPARRYASASALADDLGRFLARLPILARPVPPWERAWKAVVRRPAIASLATTIVVVTTVGLGLVLWQWRRAEATARAEAATRHEAQLLTARMILDRGLALCAQRDAGRGLTWLARGLTIVPSDARDLQAVFRANLASWSTRITPMRAAWSHPEGVQSVAWSPDGRILATGCRDRAVRLWDVATGRPIGPPMLHDAELDRVAFSPDGRTLASSGFDAAARLWDVATGRPLGQPLAHSKRVRALAFSPDGRSLATGSDDQAARIWNVDGHVLEQILRHPDTVTAVAWSPDGKRLATGCIDRAVRLWDPRTGQLLGILFHQDRAINAVAWSPDGRLLASAGRDNTAWLWDLTASRPLIPPLVHTADLRALAFSPDGSTLMTCGIDHTAQLWDVASGQALGSPLSHLDEVHTLAISPDGRTLATGCDDGVVRLWDLAPNLLGPPRPATLALASNLLPREAIDADRTRVLASRVDGTAVLLDVRTGQPLSHPFRQRDAIRCVAFRPDGKVIATGGKDHQAQVWDVTTGQPLGPPLDCQGEVLRLAFSPDGRIIATGCTNSLRFWDASTGRPITPAIPQGGSIVALAFGPDGRMLATGGTDWVARLWDATSGQPLGAPMRHTNWVRHVTFSPDGATLLTGSNDATARLWDVAKGQPESPPLRHDMLLNVAVFSPDGKTVLTGGFDKTARLWDAGNGRLLVPPLEHNSPVLRAVFSPSGRVVATGCQDGTSWLWDGVTAKPLGAPWPHRQSVLALAFTTEETVLVLTADEKIHTWNRPPSLTLDPASAVLWVQVLTSMEMDASGAITPLEPTTWARRRDQLERLGIPMETDR